MGSIGVGGIAEVIEVGRGGFGVGLGGAGELEVFEDAFEVLGPVGVDIDDFAGEGLGEDEAVGVEGEAR